MPSERIAFLFSAQGGQWPGMGASLYAQEPVARAMIEACDQVIAAMLGWSLAEEMSLPAERWRAHREADRVQPALTALQLSIAALLRSRGVEPQATIGLSMGEVAAAHVAGALGVTDAMRVVCTQALLARREIRPGRMIVVALSAADARTLLGGEAEAGIAVELTPGVTVLSGERAAVDRLAARAARQGVRVGDVAVGAAFHSEQMEPLRVEFLRSLATITPVPGRIVFHSAAAGGAVAGERLDAHHWWRIMSGGAHFVSAIRSALSDGIGAMVEIGPSVTLRESVRDIATSAAARVSFVPAMDRGGGGEMIQRAIAALGAYSMRA